MPRQWAPSPTPDGWMADLIRLPDPLGATVRLRRAPHHWVEAGGTPPGELPAEHLHRALSETASVRATESRTRQIILVGDGPAARAIGSDLARRPRVALVLGRDPTRPAERPADWQTGLLAERHPGVRPPRWTDAQPDDVWRPGSVAVVVTAGVEPDRALVRRLTRRGAEHLIVRVHRGVALVGPFVVPGRTACLECQDHWLAAHDQGYAYVLNELEQLEALTDEGSTGWAAAVTGRHLSSPDAGRRALGGHVEVSDPLFPTLRGVAVAPHPSCRCGAAGHAASTT